MKNLTTLVLASIWVAQMPALADEGFGKKLFQQVVNTGKSEATKSLGKVTGGATAATVPASTAATGATTAAAQSAGKTKTLTKTAEDAIAKNATKYGKKYGQKYVNVGEQKLEKMITGKKALSETTSH